MNRIRSIVAAAVVPLALVDPTSLSGQEIRGISFDWATHRRVENGADNWPLTWAADGHQYTHGGDGFGWNGSLSPKSGNFVVRVKGGRGSYTGENRYVSGRMNCGEMCGKSYGILALGGDLYMWLAPNSQSENFERQTLYRSTDDGLTWERVGVRFPGEEYNLAPPTFLNFGRNYARARDGYVYVYAADVKDDSGLNIQKPGEIWLMRVPKGRIEDRAAYEWFTGTPHQPSWGAFRDRRPVFEDRSGVSWNTGSVIWVPELDRYVLATEHTASQRGNIHLAQAPEPWGPWTTFLRVHEWPTRDHVERDTFYWNFSPKWFSADGREFVMVFSGAHSNDSWNSVEGSFLTASPDDSTPHESPAGRRTGEVEDGGG